MGWTFSVFRILNFCSCRLMQLLYFFLFPIPSNADANSMITQRLEWTYLQRLVRQPIKKLYKYLFSNKEEKKTSNSRTLPSTWVQCYFKRGKLQREEKCVKRVSFISNSLWLPFWIFFAFHWYCTEKNVKLFAKNINTKMCTSQGSLRYYRSK